MRKVTAISSAVVSAIFLLCISACTTATSTSAPASGPNTSSGTGTPSAKTSAVVFVHPGELTVCTNPPYAPFETLKGTQIGGLDMDIMKKVANSLGVTLKPINTPFEQIESGAALNAGNCDVLASGMTINATRATKFNFSAPYYTDQAGVLTKDSSITNVATLKNKKIVVQRATITEDWVKNKGLTYVETTDLGTQIQTVKSGQADAAITDVAVLAPYATGNYHIAFTITMGGQYGFGVNKTNTGLLTTINNTLHTMTSDGTMTALYKKYSIPTSSLVTYDTTGKPTTPNTPTG